MKGTQITWEPHGSKGPVLSNKTDHLNEAMRRGYVRIAPDYAKDFGEDNQQAQAFVKKYGIDYIRQCIKAIYSVGQIIRFSTDIFNDTKAWEALLDYQRLMPMPFSKWIGVVPVSDTLAVYYIENILDLRQDNLLRREYDTVLMVAVFMLEYSEMSGGMLTLIAMFGLAQEPEGPAYVVNLGDIDILDARENSVTGMKDVAFMLWLINMATVAVDRIVPAEKLAKARRRRGKPPLPTYYHLHAAPYITQLRESTARGAPQGGTHASPIPHSRRAHDRHYKDGKVVRIRSTLVNLRGPEAMKRLFYTLERAPT